MTLGELVQIYAEDCVEIRKLDKRINALRRWWSHLFAMELEDIETKHVRSGRARVVKAGCTKSTANWTVAVLGGLLAWGKDSGYTENLPHRGLKKLVYQADSVELQYPDADRTRLDRHLEALPINSRTRQIVTFALYTGMRRGELLKLRHEDVDLERGVITVRFANSKSKKRRYVPMSDRVLSTYRAILRARVAHHGERATGLVWPGPQGGEWSGLGEAWKGLQRAAGLPQRNFHSLRHECASSLVRSNVHISLIQDLLGHYSVTETQRYIHLRPETMRAAVNQADQSAQTEDTHQ